MAYLALLVMLYLVQSVRCDGYDLYHRPQIIRGPGVKKVNIGRNVMYKCETFGDPTPTLTWEFEGKPLSPDDRVHITQVNMVSILQIKNATAASEGQYCCNAYDGHYKSAHCGRLNVKRVPEIVRAPQNESIKVGQRTIFKCAADAFPKATIWWSHDGKRIDCIKKLFDSCGPYVLTYSNSLRIIDAKPSDGGWYSCTAKNQIGETNSVHAYLEITGVPPLASKTTKVTLTTILDATSVLTMTSPGQTTREIIDTVTLASAENRNAAIREATATVIDAQISPTSSPDAASSTLSWIRSPSVSTDAEPFLTPTVPISRTLATTLMDTMGNHSEMEPTDHDGHTKEGAIKTSQSILDDLYHSSSLDHEMPNNTTIIAAFVGACLIITCIVFLCCVARKKKQLKRKSTRIMKCHHSMRLCRNGKLHCKVEVEDNLELMSYPVDQLKIIEELGEGVFGLVFKASAPNLLGDQKDMIVAVKTIRVSDRKNLLRAEDFNREAELLSTFHHDNIVQLLGICFDGDAPPGQKNISCLLFEYVDGGDLCAFLRSRGPNRSLFQIKMTDENSLEDLNDQDKLSISTDIARGMKYLSERNFIHRDLATRNCLISTATFNVKIADFGLSRRTYESDYYKASDSESVPIRWMAPESILYGKYSQQSDVWAFGVTLWEVYTYALQPYFSLTNEEVICCICQGNILSSPPEAPAWMYNLMQLCWHTAPDSRPSFSTVYSVLEAIIQNKGELPMSEILPPDPGSNLTTETVLEEEPPLPLLVPPPDEFARPFPVVTGAGAAVDESEYVPCASLLSATSTSTGKESIV